MSLEFQTQKPIKKPSLDGLCTAKSVLRHPLCVLLFAILLFVLTITSLGSGLKAWTEGFLLKPGVIETMGVSPHFDTFQGTLLQQKAFQTPGVLPIYGSSEMSMINDYHPAKVFTPETGVTPFLIGKGGSQTIIHVLSLGSLENLQGKKVVVFLTPQWYGPNGIQTSTFEGNFSPLHAYQVLYSSELSPRLKRQIAQRILKFPGAYKDYPYLKKVLTDEANSGIKAKAEQFVSRVPARLEYAALEVQDFLKTKWHVENLSLKKIREYSQKEKNLKPMAWDQLREEAKLVGRNSTTNNSFGMDNKFYEEYLISRLQEKKNADKDDKLSVSPEYDDLQLLMQVLREKGAKPLFVIQPMNGRWYDYSGLQRSEREFCYAKLNRLIQEEGYPVADFSSHEYEDYYLKDPWHLAWKGWVDVNQRLYDFYKE
jgi:D-alanine transfer protein